MLYGPKYKHASDLPIIFLITRKVDVSYVEYDVLLVEGANQLCLILERRLLVTESGEALK